MSLIKKQYIVLFLFASTKTCQQPPSSNDLDNNVTVTFQIKKIKVKNEWDSAANPDNKELDSLQITFQKEMPFGAAWNQLIYTVASRYHVSGPAIQPSMLGNISKEEIESWKIRGTTLRQVLHQNPSFLHFAMVVNVRISD